MAFDSTIEKAKFHPGQIVKHRFYSVSGVIIDVDFTFNQSEEWLESIPKDIRPHKNQPFYHLLADNGESTYIAYVSEQNLELEPQQNRVFDRHEALNNFFIKKNQGYQLNQRLLH